MDRLKKAITIGGGLLIFVLLMLAIAGITGWLPHSDDKYYIALTGVATLILAAGTLAFMWSQTETSKRVAGLQMLVQIDTQYNTDPLHTVRHDLAPLLIAGCHPVPASAESVLDFMEMLACYNREGYIDFKLVSNGFSLPVRCYWYALKNYVSELRGAHCDNTLYEHVEWLNAKLVAERATEQKADLTRAALTKEQVDRFLRSETSTIVIGKPSTW